MNIFLILIHFVTILYFNNKHRCYSDLENLILNNQATLNYFSDVTPTVNIDLGLDFSQLCSSNTNFARSFSINIQSNKLLCIPHGSLMDLSDEKFILRQKLLLNYIKNLDENNILDYTLIKRSLSRHLIFNESWFSLSVNNSTIKPYNNLCYYFHYGLKYKVKYCPK